MAGGALAEEPAVTVTADGDTPVGPAPDAEKTAATGTAAAAAAVAEAGEIPRGGAEAAAPLPQPAEEPKAGGHSLAAAPAGAGARERIAPSDDAAPPPPVEGLAVHSKWVAGRSQDNDADDNNGLLEERKYPAVDSPAALPAAAAAAVGNEEQQKVPLSPAAQTEPVQRGADQPSPSAARVVAEGEEDGGTAREPGFSAHAVVGARPVPSSLALVDAVDDGARAKGDRSRPDEPGPEVRVQYGSRAVFCALGVCFGG